MTGVERAEQAEAHALRCTRCGSPTAVCEEVVGCLDWGLAVVDAEGVVRPQQRPASVPVIMADNSGVTVPFVYCDNPDCGHRWRLRRRFDPTEAS